MPLPRDDSGDHGAAGLAARARRWLPVAIGALVALGVGRFAALHTGCLYDDAYIYFRYVRLAREGCAYCFNPGGPRVEGVTSPLYFASLLLASHAGVRLTVAVTAIGALGVFAAVFTAAMLPLRRSTSIAVGAASSLALALLAFDDWLGLNAVIGVESALGMGLVALAARSALLPGRPWLGAWAVAASLARPEAMLLVALLPVLPEMRSLRRLAPVGVALAAIAAARWWAFRDLVPNTYHAKSGGTAQHALLGAQYIAEVVRAQPLLLLAPLGIALREARDGARYLLLVAGLWFAFFLRSGGDHFQYGRLAAPVLAPLIALGVWAAVDLASRRARWGGAVAAGALAATIGYSSVAHRIPEQHSFENVRRWARLGAALRERMPGASLAAVPIGAIGFYSQARLLDLVGLPEARIARHGGVVPPAEMRRTWVGHERHDTAWVLAQRPDVIITTRWRDRPWTSLDEIRPGFYADRLIWAEAVAGRAPYELLSFEAAPREHWFLLLRRDAQRWRAGAGGAQGAPAARGADVAR